MGPIAKVSLSCFPIQQVHHGFIYTQIPLPLSSRSIPLSASPRAKQQRHRIEVLSLQGNPPSLRSMADEWWSSTSHRSHGASACSAAPLAVVTDRVACGWATSPTAATAESTSSITFQDPYRSSTHQPLSDAASSLGDPHADWTQAFL